MKLVDIPTRFNIPFANAAGGGYVRTVPEASQIGIQDGAASLTDGYPPLNFLPVGAGGVPPFGQDMNGILKQITEWSRWQGAGGLATYDAGFSTAVGGYPRGSLIASSSTPNIIWLNTIDDNTSNPDAGGAGWVPIATSVAIQSNQFTYAVATGTANALIASLSPAPASISNGFSFDLLIASTNTAAASLNLNGDGAKPIILMNGMDLRPGDLAGGQIARFVRSGTNYLLQTPNNVPATTLAANGTTRLSEGVIIKWGAISGNAGGTGTQNFADPFPTACVTVQLTDVTSGSLATVDSWGYDNLTNSSFRWWTVNQSGAANPGGCTYLAIGY